MIIVHGEKGKKMSKSKEFIFANALDKTIEDYVKKHDLEPVKHGHWEWTDDPRTGDFVCSNCLDHNIVRSRYCPTCGAKMDGERRKDAKTNL